MAEETARLSSTIRAPCSVCRRIMPVTRAGLVCVHGPVGHRCSGSRIPPAPLRQSLPAACYFAYRPTTFGRTNMAPPEPSTRVIFPIWPSALGKDREEDSARFPGHSCQKNGCHPPRRYIT